MDDKIGVYCGSFNPFHAGHKDVLDQADLLFSHVILARGINDSKDSFLNPLSEEIYSTYNVMEYDCLLTEFLDKLQKSYPKSTIVLIRGLRNGKDLEEEQNLRDWLNLDNYNVIYFMANKDLRHVSSSSIRKLQYKYPHLVERYL